MQIEDSLKDDLKKVIKNIDKNGDGYLQYEEFVGEAHNLCTMISDLYLKNAFNLFDLSEDNGGDIPINHFKSIMCGAIGFKTAISHEQWEDFID